MEDNKYRKFYLDWWNVRRSSVYVLSGLLALAIVAAAGSWLAVRYDWFAQTENGAAPRHDARIISFEGDVRVTKAATRETIVVTRETYVSPGDTIQTQADGRAVVQMIDGSVYTVRANSTVVIRDHSSLFGGTNVRVSLDDGQLNVRTDQQPDNTENVVEMLNSETQLRSQTDASFSADAARNGGEIRISRGSVETTIGGERTMINANEFVAVNEGQLSQKERLLSPPRLASPGNMSQIHEGPGGGASITFTWQDENSIPVTGYYLQVARSPYFSSDSMLVDRGSLTGREFRLTALSPGTYYWRLKANSKSGQVSEWNDAWRFSVVKRQASPLIEVGGWDVDPVGGNVFVVTGRTQPGLRVRALEREVFTAGDGFFRIQVATPLSEVGIELSDDRGNRTGYVLSLRTSRVIRRF